MGRLNRRSCTRFDDADDRHTHRTLQDIETGSRGGVTSDDHELYIVVLEPMAHLTHKHANLGLRARAIGAALGIANIINR